MSLYNDKRVNSKEDTTILSVSGHSNIILTDLNGEIESNAIAVRDFSTPLSVMERVSR